MNVLEEKTAGRAISETLKEQIDDIYKYYVDHLLPEISSSLPMLLRQMRHDSRSVVYNGAKKIMHFLIPFTREDFEWHGINVPHPHVNLTQVYGNLTQSLVEVFNLEHENRASISEWMKTNMEALKDIQQHIPVVRVPTAPRWLHFTWPFIDWNFGLLLWRSCGGLILLIVFASIVPGKLHSFSGRILRWPILAFTNFAIVSELLVYIVVRLFIRAAESLFSTKKHRSMRKALEKAGSYEEWLQIARQLDSSQGRDAWQITIDDETAYKYNWKFINELITDLKQARRTNDLMLALVVLQQCTRKNVGGIMNEDLFSYTNSGETKYIVSVFLDEVVTTLRWMTEQCRDSHVEHDRNERESLNMPTEKHNKNLMDHVIQPVTWAIHTVGNSVVGGREPQVLHAQSTDDANKYHKLQREQVKTFLKRARASYGRTALCLSGGAMMGCYHFGHVQALLDENILPHIISGTSAGSVIAAMLCTRTDDEIRRDMRPEVLVDRLTCFSKTWPDRLRNVYKNGCLFDQEEWLELIKWFTMGDMTFEESYKKTGRILCITLSATTKKAPPVLVNYITAPNVTIASAIIASAAVPGFIKPVILRKKGPDGKVRPQAQNKDEAYWDGSIDQDIPTTGLAEMFNCQFFLAAQANPHIVPFFHDPKGCVAQPSRWTRGENYDAWRGGILLAALEIYLKTDMRSKFHFLNDLGAGVGFTSTMFTQALYSGTTTIVPKVSFVDYFQLFSNPSLPFLHKCFQVGSVAAYQHCQLMKMHYTVANALDECLAILENEDGVFIKPRRRLSQLKTSQLLSSQFYKGMAHIEAQQRMGKGCTLNSSAFPKDEASISTHTSSGRSSICESLSDPRTDSSHDDEYEGLGFDGVSVDFRPPKHTKNYESHK